MIMLSRPEFAALSACRATAPRTPVPDNDWRGLSWPANEIMLRSLLATGRTIGEIATLYGVATERVIRLANRYGM